MIKTFCGMVIRILMYIMTSFLFLGLNVFTIPLMVLLWLMCKLVKTQTPHLTHYSLMVYPTWSNKKCDSLWDDMQKIKRKEDAKIVKHKSIHPWEARFFD